MAAPACQRPSSAHHVGRLNVPPRGTPRWMVVGPMSCALGCGRVVEGAVTGGTAVGAGSGAAGCSFGCVFGTAAVVGATGAALVTVLVTDVDGRDRCRTRDGARRRCRGRPVVAVLASVAARSVVRCRRRRGGRRVVPRRTPHRPQGSSRRAPRSQSTRGAVTPAGSCEWAATARCQQRARHLRTNWIVLGGDRDRCPGRA